MTDLNLMPVFVDIHINRPAKPVDNPRQIRNFLILCKAYALGIYSTDSRLLDLFAAANTMDDRTIDDMVVAICDCEGAYVKHVI